MLHEFIEVVVFIAKIFAIGKIKKNKQYEANGLKFKGHLM